MENTLRRLLYAGVGLAADATEKIEKEVDKLVEKGKTTDTEAKRIVDEFIGKTESKTGEFENKIKDLFSNFGYAKKNELVELEEKISALEAKLAAKPATPSAPTKAKTTTK